MLKKTRVRTTQSSTSQFLATMSAGCRFGVLFNLVKPLLNDVQKAKLVVLRSHEVRTMI
jgi:hypothetical protein